MEACVSFKTSLHMHADLVTSQARQQAIWHNGKFCRRVSMYVHVNRLPSNSSLYNGQRGQCYLWPVTVLCVCVVTSDKKKKKKCLSGTESTFICRRAMEEGGVHPILSHGVLADIRHSGQWWLAANHTRKVFSVAICSITPVTRWIVGVDITKHIRTPFGVKFLGIMYWPMPLSIQQ